ncbi:MULTISPECIES: sortase-dependent protein [unclassified Streptomyces]|uniref:sortase-dependent protein n=1 Tax=unclassified Streptomyces TaxID=2593676 RepID=UPI003D92AE7A
MRRTVLSSMALACTAVLAGTVPAFADGATATPSPVPTRASSAAPSAEPTRAPSAVPSRASSPAPARGQVSVVPSGAPDTGVVADSSPSGATDGLIGGGAAAVLVAGGAAVFVVRRRRASGA